MAFHAGRMWNRVSIAAAGLMGLAVVGAALPAQAGPGYLSTPQAAADEFAALRHNVLFGHRKQTTELYCVDQAHWWYYRPYQTAGENYARCMPYFHYPEQQQGAYPPAPGGLK